jgi:glycosyltransferase involved in cell wall biosynthesis
MNASGKLVVIETHPIQYHAPVYRVLQSKFGINVTAIYGSDFSIRGYYDSEFDATFSWDNDLLSGYSSIFLSSVVSGGARSVEEVSVRGLSKALTQIAPSVVLLVGYSPSFHQRSFWLSWKAGYTLIFRAETTDHTQSYGIHKRWIRDNLLRWFYRQFSSILYIGSKSLEHYKRLNCPDEKLVFSPYCVDTAGFQMSEYDRETLRLRTRHGLKSSEQDYVILFSGKLIHRKAPDSLLQAIKKLPREIRERTIILFLGNGHMADSLKQSAHEIPSIKVHFLGFQNQSSLSQYYHAADLLVLPSRKETWGLVVNEALHHGLPCVVSDKVGCAPDLLEPGKTGEMFKANSVEKLTVSILKALNLTRQEIVREYCRIKVSHYTVEKAAEGIAKAYHAVMDSKTPR